MAVRVVKSRPKSKAKVLSAKPSVKTKVLSSKPDKSKVLATKPSMKSGAFKSCVLPLLSGKDESIDRSKMLPELIRNIFTGDERSIKDSYAALVAYLVLDWKEVTYDRFVGAYEAVKLGHQSENGVCSALPYGALVASGTVFKWEAEQQNQVVSKMLKIYQNRPESKNVVFHFLLALDSRVKLSSHKLKKVCVDSPVQLYFTLSVESKQDLTRQGASLFRADNVLGLVDVYLQESEDPELYKKVSCLLAKKLFSLGDDTVIEFWDKTMVSLSESRTDYRDVAVLQLLSSFLENFTSSSLEINKLFTPCVIKILSKSSPKIEPVFKRINDSLRNLSDRITGETKLAIIEAVVVNTEKYLEKSLVVKISDTLVASMPFQEVSHVAELYKKVITGEKHKATTDKRNKTDEFTDFERIYCVRSFGKLIGLNSCKHQVDWRKTQLKFLFKIGFLTEYKETASTQLAGLSRKIFYSSLNQKFAKLTDLDTILKKLVKFAGERMNNKEENFVVPFKENAYNIWFKTLNVLKQLKENNDRDTLVFKVLLRYMMVFMFSDYQVAKSTLNELFRVIENKETEVGELDWTEVTVDMFLHLLSGDDNTHKNVIHSTFSHVCKHMTPGGLDLILSAVKGKENVEDRESDGDSESSDGGEEESSDESASDSDDDEVTEENENQIDKLKDALRQELYKIDTASTCGSVDLEELEESEGKQLNSTLAEIFKQQHSRYKSSSKHKTDNLELHFRIRVVNLLEIYIENDPSLCDSIVILSCIVSLLKESVPNHTLAPLTVGLKRCLKKLTDLKEFSNVDSVTETGLCSTLNLVLSKDCPSSVYQDITEQIVDSCLFLIRSAAFVSEKSGEVSACVKEIVKEYFADADSHVPFLLLTQMFSSLSLEKLTTLALCVVKIAFSSDKVKRHKRTQALQLLMTFYNNNRLFKDVSGYETSLGKIEQQILEKSTKLIHKTTEEFESNKKYSCMFLDLLCLLKTKNKYFTQEPGPHWDSIDQIVNQISDIPTFQKELKVSFVNFQKIFNSKLPEASTKACVNGSYPTNNKKRKSEPKPSGSQKKKKSKKASS